MQKHVTAQSLNPLAIIKRQFSRCGQCPMFQRFQFSQRTFSSVFWSLFTVQLAISDRVMELEMEFQLISINRYLHMNANTFKKAHKKVNSCQTTADGFQDCIWTNAFCLSSLSSWTVYLSCVWKMSLGVKNESSIFHDNLPIRLPVYTRKMMTDGGASRKVSGYPKSNESHPLGNSS